ncbi:unnamed protein product (mitochondrion) [Plasmodiophora brassicae]|uniref:Uncharacterized protein n=1 Tax=Plasmodiophora brassicae TaxID=37360 RepID=A0A0G4IH91_PLABS|nr:hypothetical protein PBRA_000280 [Plasmodiophora brassicae]SPQ96841.1 unnamed protein product [Plasmodiophora brassicae]
MTGRPVGSRDRPKLTWHIRYIYEMMQDRVMIALVAVVASLSAPACARVVIVVPVDANGAPAQVGPGYNPVQDYNPRVAQVQKDPGTYAPIEMFTTPPQTYTPIAPVDQTYPPVKAKPETYAPIKVKQETYAPIVPTAPPQTYAAKATPAPRKATYESSTPAPEKYVEKTSSDVSEPYSPSTSAYGGSIPNTTYGGTTKYNVGTSVPFKSGKYARSSSMALSLSVVSAFLTSLMVISHI